MILTLKNLLFTLAVPGTVGVYAPLMISRSRTAATGFVFTLALLLFTIGGSIYAWCVFDFGVVRSGHTAPARCSQEARQARLVPLLAKSHVCRRAYRDFRLRGSVSKPSRCGVRSCRRALLLLVRRIPLASDSTNQPRRAGDHSLAANSQLNHIPRSESATERARFSFAAGDANGAAACQTVSRRTAPS